MMKTEELIKSLERNATELLPGVGMNTFKEGVVTCPWLRFWTGLSSRPDYVRGILILQDWGVDEIDGVLLSEQVTGIQNSFRTKLDPDTTFEDATIHNLKSIPELKGKIENGEILVVNAVWGCRSSDSDKCGYLGKKVHAKAFTIWSKLVSYFAIKENFFVVFCGDWARFERMSAEDNNLKKFMERWAKWAGNGDAIQYDNVKGRSYFCAHPCTWQITSDNSEQIIIHDPEVLIQKLVMSSNHRS